jgi:hypothetical protein
MRCGVDDPESPVGQSPPSRFPASFLENGRTRPDRRPQGCNLGTTSANGAKADRVIWCRPNPLSQPHINNEAKRRGNPEWRKCRRLSYTRETEPPRPNWLAGAPGFEPGNGGIKSAVPHKHWNNAVQWINLSPRSVGHHRDRLVSPEPELAPARHRGVGFAVSECMRRPVKQFELSR